MFKISCKETENEKLRAEKISLLELLFDCRVSSIHVQVMLWDFICF